MGQESVVLGIDEILAGGQGVSTFHVDGIHQTVEVHYSVTILD